MAKLETAEDIRSELWVLNYYTSEEGKQKAFRCVQKAQNLKDLELEFEARYAYIHQLVFLNYQEEAVAMFPWLLNMCDKYPDRFDYYDALWVYKWILGNIGLSSKITLKQIEAILKDFEDRYRNYGAGEKVILYYKIITAHRLGRMEHLLENIQKYDALIKGGSLDDCEACQLDELLLFHNDLREFDKTLKLAEPIISGKLTCGQVPEDTNPKLLHASMMIGKWELADKYAQKVSNKIKNKKQNFVNASPLLTYFAIKGKESRGKKLLEYQLSYLNQNSSEYKKLYFFLAAHLFINSLIQKGKDKLVFKLEENVFLKKIMDNFGTESTDLSAFSVWLIEEAMNCAQSLDSRNENAFYTNDIEFRLEQLDKYSNKIS
jgi:hypothetical protein